MPRAGVGIQVVFGSIRDSWRVLEFWGDQRGRAEASVEQVYLRSFPHPLSPAQAAGDWVREEVGRNSSLLLCLLRLTFFLIPPLVLFLPYPGPLHMLFTFLLSLCWVCCILPYRY